jgi:hypothetical protein
MNFGFENGKFYIELQSKSRPVKDLYSESLIRAEEISVNSNIVVSNSGGLDSQVMLHAFRKQGIDFQSAFLYLPGYNDNELAQVKFCDSKYGINTDIISIDPLAIKDRIDQLSLSLDIPNKHAILQKLFVEQLPKDATVFRGVAYESEVEFIEEGTIFTDKGLISTSTTFQFARSFGDGSDMDLVFDIQIPKGTKVWAPKTPFVKQETEITLRPGTRFKVKQVYNESDDYGDVRRVVMEVIND